MQSKRAIIAWTLTQIIQHPLKFENEKFCIEIIIKIVEICKTFHQKH